MRATRRHIYLLSIVTATMVITTVLIIYNSYAGLDLSNKSSSTRSRAGATANYANSTRDGGGSSEAGVKTQSLDRKRSVSISTASPTAMNDTSVINQCDLPSMNEQNANSYSSFRPLPPSVVDGVKTFVFFIGIGRSGHSIIASILDSHPHMVVSNEFHLFKILNITTCVTDKSFLFNQIWSKSFTQVNTSLKDPSKGYRLALDGLYQGSYKGHIDVIGDKMGGSTIAFFLSEPTRFKSHVNKLRSMLNIPIKVFHIIRNPFDNIATKSLHVAFNFHYSRFAAVKKHNTTVKISHKIIDRQIGKYFQFYKASNVVKRIFQMDMMEIHSRDLITNPKTVISNVCNFLKLHCSDTYLSVVSNKVFLTESKTRYNIEWKDDQILLVKEHIQRFETLQRYLDFNY